METDAARQERRRRAAPLGAASAALSAACVAFCVLLSIGAADLRNRVLDLEKPASVRAPGPGPSGEDLDLLVEQKVKELLSQVTRR